MTIVKSSLAPLETWQAMKEVMRRQLGQKAWELWVSRTRLMRVMGSGSDHATLLIALPRSGPAIWEAQKQVPLMRRLARRMSYHVAFTIQPTDDQARYWQQEKGFTVSYLEAQ